MVLIRRLMVAGIFAATLIAGWMFAARNADTVAVDVLAVRVSDVKLWLALLIAFAAGGLLAGVIGMLALAKARMVTRRYRKSVAGLESEVHQLRNLPLASGNADASQAVLAEGSGTVGTVG